MPDALTIAGSALYAQSQKLAVTANNVANAETPDYQPQQAVFAAMDPGVGVSTVAATAQSVDLGSEMVNTITARSAYSAALKVVATSKRMNRALLEI
jgi:flagellar basal body rod protein FlgC